MTHQGYDINILYQEAQTRWLKPSEVLFILQNHEKYQITQESPQRPISGSLFLFNKRVLRFFRKDGHNWRKKRDGRTVGEAHERLKVGNVEALNCYYAHGEEDPNFQRRCFWILDPAYDHIVLVHYRDVSEGKVNFGSTSQLSPVSSSTFCQSSSPTKNLGSASIISDVYEPYQSQYSPGSVEVSSDTIIINRNRINPSGDMDRTGMIGTSPELEVNLALRRLEEQLSLNDDIFDDINPFGIQDENTNDLGSLEYERDANGQDPYNLLGDTLSDQLYGGRPVVQHDSSDLVLLQKSGDNNKHYHQSFANEYTVGSNESFPWEKMLESCKSSSGVGAQGSQLYALDDHQKNPVLSERRERAEANEQFQWSNLDGNHVKTSSTLLPQEVENFTFSAYTPVVGAPETNPNYYSTLFDQVQIGMPFEADPVLTIAQKQKYTIQEISPEWGYASEATKVIIVGSFLCDPSESAWTCMFGDIEVPLQIIQQGVICCEAPPNTPGKATLCITSGNRESCSEVKEFEYRIKNSHCIHCNSLQTQATKTLEELLLVVRFVQMLMADPSIPKEGGTESGLHLLQKLKANDEPWDHIIEALLVGSETSFSTINWILEELLKDKLQQWLASKSHGGQDDSDCSLSKKEQGIIHMVAGLGFSWALNPILSHGVSVNFRDINGWTALHWAARFGREKIVAALIASGASAGAVTDPTRKDPVGKTAASIAASSGHKGLAGYLSEVALTSHLSSLTLTESELSKGSAEIEAERTVNSISQQRLSANEDQISLKDTLAAVRNAAQAAARIQSAFRAHSFRKRQMWEAADGAVSIDDYSIDPDDARALSKMAFGSARDYNSAALSIQKKYRGWKGRKDFLAVRRKIVKIQAHIRGYQVRKNYKVICWAVGVLDKVVLRWRRKGVGLRGFRKETCIDETESEDEDILKVFRKQKVDKAIDEAVSRVLMMVDSSDARQQYRRMLEKYREAKAELGTIGEAASSTSLSNDVPDMDSDHCQ